VISLLDQAIHEYNTPREILTDHGSQFWSVRKGESSFDTYCQQQRIKHILGGIGKPTTQGKIERWFRTYDLEIHHLDFQGKSQIYAKIFRDLKFDGLFLNSDPVLPTSKRSEQWQFNMWTDWIKEHLQRNGMKEDAGKIDAILLCRITLTFNESLLLFAQFCSEVGC
jgi:transposase InsO family protein